MRYENICIFLFCYIVIKIWKKWTKDCENENFIFKSDRLLYNFFFLSLKYQFFTYTFLYLCMFIKMKVSFIFKVKTVKYLVKLFFNRKMIGRIDSSRWNTIFTTPRRTGRNENLHWSTCEPCIYCDRYHVPVL